MEFLEGFFPKGRQAKPETSRVSRAKRSAKKGGTANVLFAAAAAAAAQAGALCCALVCAVLMLTGRTDWIDQEQGRVKGECAVCVYVYVYACNCNKEG